MFLKVCLRQGHWIRSIQLFALCNTHDIALFRSPDGTELPSPNSVPSVNNTALKLRCSETTTMSVLFCCTSLRAGEWSEQTRGEWRCFHNRSLRRIRQISWSSTISNHSTRSRSISKTPEVARTCAEDGAGPHPKGGLKMDTTSHLGGPKPAGVELRHKSWSG